MDIPSRPPGAGMLMMSDICPYMDMLMDMLMMADDAGMLMMSDICPYMDMLMDETWSNWMRYRT